MDYNPPPNNNPNPNPPPSPSFIEDNMDEDRELENLSNDIAGIKLVNRCHPLSYLEMKIILINRFVASLGGPMLYQIDYPRSSSLLLHEIDEIVNINQSYMYDPTYSSYFNTYPLVIPTDYIHTRFSTLLKDILPQEDPEGEQKEGTSLNPNPLDYFNTVKYYAEKMYPLWIEGITKIIKMVNDK